MVIPISTQTLSATSFEKDLEIPSNTQNSTSIPHENDIDKEEKGEELDADDEADVDDFDENDPNSDGYGRRADGAALGTRATKTSTKSSWKDPGPPPDGGLVGWTQGELMMFQL